MACMCLVRFALHSYMLQDTVLAAVFAFGSQSRERDQDISSIISYARMARERGWGWRKHKCRKGRGTVLYLVKQHVPMSYGILLNQTKKQCQKTCLRLVFSNLVPNSIVSIFAYFLFTPLSLVPCLDPGKRSTYSGADKGFVDGDCDCVGRVETRRPLETFTCKANTTGL